MRMHCLIHAQRSSDDRLATLVGSGARKGARLTGWHRNVDCAISDRPHPPPALAAQASMTFPRSDDQPSTISHRHPSPALLTSVASTQQPSDSNRHRGNAVLLPTPASAIPSPYPVSQRPASSSWVPCSHCLCWPFPAWEPYVSHHGPSPLAHD